MKQAIHAAVWIFLLAGMGLSVAAQSTKWTTEQQDVWKTETAITDLWLKGDWKSALAYYDDSYQGWPNRSPIPIPKENMAANMNYNMSEGGKLLFWNAVPMVIWVKNNFAYTDYYYRAVWQDKDGKKTNEHGHWLDILMKNGDKWVLVGDHGGADPETK